jgi:DNA polymerase III sliding clamp (beta) subunit (PCNA family)
MADDIHRRVDLVFYSDKVLLKSESPETGNSVEEVGCTFQILQAKASGQTDDDDGWKIAFNTKYLMDFINSARRDEQRIVWKFTGQAQTEIMFEGEERLFSYILVALKA